MPHTEHGNTITIPLNDLERAVLIHALDTHEPKLESNLKASRELGAPNSIAELHLNVINGTGGWGQSLASKLRGNITLAEQDDDDDGDQLDIGDEGKKVEEDTERAKFEQARAEFAGKLSTIPALSQAHPDYVLRIVRGWTTQQVEEAADYLWQIEAKPDAPKPTCVDALCDRIEEAQMSPDEVAFWLDYGPAIVGQGIYENSTVTYFYAQIVTEVDPKVPGDPITFTPNFETLEEAQASAARINRSEWKLANPDAKATPWDQELAKGASEILTPDLSPKAKNRKKGEKVAEPDSVAGD